MGAVSGTDEGTCEPKRRGRPRSAGADEAILAAAIDLAGEVGINGMSMDDLAAHAGVSKSSIYRRWSSKEQLVLDALRSAMNPFDDVDTGSLRTDLDLYLAEFVERVRAGQMSDVLPHLIEVACHDDAVRSSLDDYVRHRRRPLTSILEHAIERGELDAATDVGVLVDAIIAPFVYRQLLSRDEVDAAFVDRLLDIVIPTR